MEYVYVHILENRLVMYKAFYFNQTKTLLYSSVSQKINRFLTISWNDFMTWHDIQQKR